MQNLITSNRVEILAEVLKKKLFAGNTHPLAEQWVIVPSQAMKRWLMMNIADDPALGSSMGLKFPYLEKVVQGLSPLVFPSRRELGFLIEQKVEEALFQERFPDLLAILQELHITAETLHHKGARKALAAFSEEVARLFLDYNRYAGALVEEWRKKSSFDDWQAWIFQAVFPEGLEKAEKYPPIHIFCPSFIPKAFLKLFEKTTLYSLASTVHYLERAEGSWLSELGLVEKQFFSFFDEEAAKAFQMPAALAEESPYSDFLTDDIFLTDEEPSLLRRVHAEFLLQPGEGPRTVQADDSIQLHSCPSKLREVEVLYSLLVDLIRNKGFTPKDVVIMAPSLSDYAPFIEAVFGSEFSSLPIQFFDVRTVSKSPLVQGFLDLIALSDSRFEKSCFVKPLYNCLFQEQLGWTESECDKVIGWMEAVSWGLSAEDRKAWFLGLYGSSEPFQMAHEGSWESAFQQIFEKALGLEIDQEPTLLKELALFDRWYSLFVSLKEDLAVLRSDDERKSMAHWIDYLNSLMKKYFGSELEGLHELGPGVTGLFAFSALRPRLEDIFTGERESYGQQNLVDAIAACSLLPMRAVPSPIICLLGLGLESFPRKNNPSSLDRRRERTDSDFSPTPSDFDRMLFLESLLSARDYLIMSHTVHAEEREPSLLVSQFMNFVQKTWGVTIKQVVHPEKIQLAKLSSSKPALKTLMEPPVFEEVTLQELSQAIRNPLKLFFEKRLDWFPKRKKKETICLSPYERATVERRALYEESEAIIESFKAKGRIPPEPLRTVVVREIETIVEEIQGKLKQLSLSSDELFSVEFIKGLREPYREKQSLFLPALQIPYQNRQVTLTGKIGTACEAGIISLKSKNLSSLAPEWPLSLAFGSELIMIHGERIRLKSVLWSHFLAHYESCLATLQPLFPEFAEGKEPASDPYVKFYELMHGPLEPRQSSFFDPLKEDLSCP